MKPPVFTITCILGLGVPFCCAATVINFGELPMQKANGVFIDGVTFGYNGPDGAEAIYGYSLGIPTENLRRSGSLRGHFRDAHYEFCGSYREC